MLSLFKLPHGQHSSLEIVRIDSTSKVDANEAVRTIQRKCNIQYLDTVIASAGVFSLNRVDKLEPDDLLEFANINVVGVVRLFQATRPLMM